MCFRLMIISAVVSAVLGFSPVWCESCGEMYAPWEMTTCAECGAEVCPICAGLYGGAGCFVCGL